MTMLCEQGVFYDTNMITKIVLKYIISTARPDQAPGQGGWPIRAFHIVMTSSLSSGSLRSPNGALEAAISLSLALDPV